MSVAVPPPPFPMSPAASTCWALRWTSPATWSWPVRPTCPGVTIVDVVGDGGKLPREAHRNTAGAAVAALLAHLQTTRGVALTIHKGLPLESGIGSSGASAVAAVVAVNELFGRPVGVDVLLACAMAGEQAGCGAAHPDNVAPALLGGFVLARNIDPPDVVRLPVPDGLACALLHPHLAIHTGTARALLGRHRAPEDGRPPMGQPRGPRGRALHRRPGAAVPIARGRRGGAETRGAGSRVLPGEGRRAGGRGAGMLAVGLGPLDVCARAVARDRDARPARRCRRHSPDIATQAAISTCRRSAAPVPGSSRDELPQHAGPGAAGVVSRGDPGRAGAGRRALRAGAPAGAGDARVGGVLDDVARRRRHATCWGRSSADDLPPADLRRLLGEALNFPAPLVPLDDRLAVLELFHGPTFAFKDVGARVLARLLSRFHEAGPAAADRAGRHLRRHRRRGGAGVSRRRPHARRGALSRTAR